MSFGVVNAMIRPGALRAAHPAERSSRTEPASNQRRGIATPQDRVAVGAEAHAAAEAAQTGEASAAESSPADGAEATPAPTEESPDGLTEEERGVVTKLKARDREVRAHEAAHQAAAAGLAGAASFTTQRGPDGHDYAVGGEVPIEMGKGKTPSDTIARAQRIRAAALAPANPSGADRSVAAAASKMEAQARAELLQDDDASATDDVSQEQVAEPGEVAEDEPAGMRGGGVNGRHHHSGPDCPTCAAQGAKYRATARASAA